MMLGAILRNRVRPNVETDSRTAPRTGRGYSGSRCCAPGRLLRRSRKNANFTKWTILRVGGHRPRNCRDVGGSNRCAQWRPCDGRNWPVLDRSRAVSNLLPTMEPASQYEWYRVWGTKRFGLSFLSSFLTTVNDLVKNRVVESSTRVARLVCRRM